MKEKDTKDQNHIVIFDSTLRDGFQAAGVNVEPEGRLRVAQLLAKMKVDVIEAGFPASNQENFISVYEISKKVNGPVICALARTTGNDIDRCWEAIEPAKDKGGARIHTFIATSNVHMIYKLRMSKEDVVEAAKTAVQRAKKYTPDVEFSAEDASRSDFDFLMRVVLTAIDAGATTINLPDTVGYAQHYQYPRLIEEAKRVIDNYIGVGNVRISTHCHDDLGDAKSNTLQGVMAGARQTEVCINGIGERAGMAPLEEVVATLKASPKVYCVNNRPLTSQVDLSYVYEISSLVENLSGIVVQPNKSIVGANAFAHESGIHQAGILNNPLTYEILRPETFGERQSRILIGAESGYSSISNRAKLLGFEINHYVTITQKVKEYANKVRREVTDMELEQIIAEAEEEKIEDIYKLESVETKSRDNDTECTLNITIDNKKYQGSSTGKGPIEAAIQAFRNATNLNTDIVNFTSKSLGNGANAKGAVFLTIKNEITITSYGENESVPFAAIKAYIAAVNTIHRAHQRKMKSSNISDSE